MAGLTHLSDMFVKKGKEFIQNLLSKEVTITEKLDGSNFNVLKTKSGFEYYKRDGKTPISLIDRTLSIYHEEPIKHFESLSDEKKNAIPEGTYFSLEYFANNQPVEVYYHKLPKNKLVIETVQYKNKFAYDKAELDKWADLLEVERAPIVFQGKLSDKQKKELMQFVATPFTQLIEKYKSQSFSRFIIGLLNPKMKTTFLKSSLDDMIEGIVFNFSGSDETIFAKVVDPAFTEMAKKKASNRNIPNDVYGIVVSDITDYINGLELTDMTISGKDFSERYISLMSQCFLEYYEDNSENYKDIAFDIPDFLNKPEHSINIKNIPYKNVVQIIKSNKNYLELYRIFLATFRKKKKRAYGYFTKEFINIFNSTVDKIHNHISATMNEISLSDIETFALINDDEDIIQSYNIISEHKDFTIIEIPSSLQNDSVDESELITEPGKNFVNVVVGRFQPLHRGHIGIGKFLKEINDLDSVYVAIRGSKPNIKSPISRELQQEMFEEAKKNEPCILDFMESNRVLFNEIFTKLRARSYEPMTFGAGEDRIEEYNEQLDFMLNKRDNMMNVHPEFKVIKTPRVTSASEVRSSIINDDKLLYERSMPKYLTSYFDKLKSDLVMTYEIDAEDINLKLNKTESNTVYDINTINGKTIIRFNPIIKDDLDKKLRKFKHRIVESDEHTKI